MLASLSHSISEDGYWPFLFYDSFLTIAESFGKLASATLAIFKEKIRFVTYLGIVGRLIF